MTYTPTGQFCHDQRMRLLLANCPTLQTRLGAADADEAIDKVWTFSPEAPAEFDEMTQTVVTQIEYPRCLVKVSEIEQRSSDEGTIHGVRATLEIWFAFYIPVLESVTNLSDEKAWFDDQISAINTEVLERQGRGLAYTGASESHIAVHSPTYWGSQPDSHDERGDPRFDPEPDLSRWFGLLTYEAY